MKLSHLTLAVMAISLAAPAIAGEVKMTRVRVLKNSDLSGWAGGTMAAARYSPNTYESILCQTGTVSNADTRKFVWCAATGNDGVFGNCLVYGGPLVDSVATMTSHSYISFNWNAAGVCTSIRVENGSGNLP